MGRPGLRGRIAAALVATAAIALAVAAITLLSPLEHRLRTQEVRNLVTAAAESRSTFAEVEGGSRSDLRLRLRQRVRRLAVATGARVAVLDARHHVIVDTDPDAPDKFRDEAAALKTDRAVRRIVHGAAGPEARVAVRIAVNGKRYV